MSSLERKIPWIFEGSSVRSILSNSNFHKTKSLLFWRWNRQRRNEKNCQSQKMIHVWHICTSIDIILKSKEHFSYHYCHKRPMHTVLPSCQSYYHKDYSLISLECSKAEKQGLNWREFGLWKDECWFCWGKFLMKIFLRGDDPLSCSDDGMNRQENKLWKSASWKNFISWTVVNCRFVTSDWLSSWYLPMILIPTLDIKWGIVLYLRTE